MIAEIRFDKAKLKKLRAAYSKAVAANMEQFTFEGHEFLTDYAKYLIEYLNGRFGGGK